MTEVIVLQGREVTDADIKLIRDLIAAHPERGRSPLSVDLCRRWDWRNAQGRLKDMACRTLLLKLERAGHIHLPLRQGLSSNGFRNRRPPPVVQAGEAIRSPLCDLQSLRVSIVAPRSEDLGLFNGLLAHEHYSGHRIQAPVKDVYLYPLVKNFKEALHDDHA